MAGQGPCASRLLLCCAMLCCVVLSRTVLCFRLTLPNTPIAIKGCQVGELYGLGSNEPTEQGNRRYTLELLVIGSLQSPASQKSIIYLGLGFGSPRDKAQHSTTHHSSSHHIIAQHRTQHSTARELRSFCGYGGAGAGAGAGGWGRGGGVEVLSASFP